MHLFLACLIASSNSASRLNPEFTSKNRWSQLCRARLPRFLLLVNRLSQHRCHECSLHCRDNGITMLVAPGCGRTAVPVSPQNALDDLAGGARRLVHGATVVEV